MKKAVLGIFGSLLFFTSVSVAFAAVTVSPLGFYCDPYSTNFTDGQAYIPNDQSNNCTFTTQNSGPTGYLVFRGSPTAGGATYLQYGTNDGTSPFILSNITFSTSGNPNQPGDPFFAVSFLGDFNTVNTFYNYFQNGIGDLPENYNLITFHWGAPATVTANNATVVQGSAIPTLTASIYGFVGTDTLQTSGITGQAACSTTATPASSVGTYPITCTIGTLSSSKYTFESFVNGTLTIASSTVDTTPPVINNLPANITTTATSTLTSVSWTAPTATDNVDGTDPVDCSPLSGSGFPVGTTTVTCTAVDHANNQSSKSFTVTVLKANQNITPSAVPSSAILGGTFTLNATSSSGLPVTYSATNCSVAGNILTFTGTGACTVTTQQTGSDLYNAATPVAQTINIGYRWDGFLQPINDTVYQPGASYSVFKAGSTVPVKFQLKKADGTIVQATALPQWLTPVKLGAMSTSVDGITYTDTPSSGNTFGWDSDQYHYNWSTKGFDGGYWYQIMAKADDGEIFWVVVGLR